MGLTLRLRVIDEAGTAVAGATVHHHDEAVATTDADGIAVVEDIGTGWDLVTVSHPMPAEARVSFSLGEGSSGVIERTVTLHRGAPLRGTVVSPDGTPLSGAQLTVWCSDDETQFPESDEHGNWVVPAMRAGAFEVRAHADGYSRGPVTSGMHDGRTEQRDVVVFVAIGARLSGRVRENGIPVAGMSVYAETWPSDSHLTTTDADGRFELLGLAAERHVVSVGHGTWQTNVVMGGDGDEQTLEVDLSATTDGEAIPVPAGAFATPDDGEEDEQDARTSTLIGRVIRDGVPVSRFAIVRRGRAAYDWISEPAIIAAPDGRFSLAGLRERTCTVHVLAEGSAWTSRAMLTLEPGSEHDLGDIVLGPGLRISGTVCDASGAPIGGAHVEVDHPGRRHDALQDAVEGHFATTSALDGTFVLDGIHIREPHVRIGAWHPIHGTSTRLLLADRRDPIRLMLVPTGTLEGVVDPVPIHSGVLVRAESDDGGGCIPEVRPSGRFIAERLLPGEYTVELVQRPRWPPRIARVTVVAGQRAFVRISP